MNWIINAFSLQNFTIQQLNWNITVRVVQLSPNLSRSKVVELSFRTETNYDTKK